MKVTHGIGKLELLTCTRAKKNQMIEIELPEKFQELLVKKALKYGVDKIEFTYAYDEITKIHTIAITHPTMDHFNRKIGYQIVKGRLERMKGEIKDREPYKEIPKYIEVEE